MDFHVHIYGWPAPADVDLAEVARFVRGLVGGEVHLTPSLAVPPERLDAIAAALALARVLNPYQPAVPRKPLPMEIEYEKRRLLEPSDLRVGIVYDGFMLSEIARGLLPEQGRRRSELYVVFTDQLVGTLDPDDRRYHARTAIFSVPVIISSAGLVHAPARPRDYYLIRHAFRTAGGEMLAGEGAEAVLREELGRRWLDRGDTRMTDVAKGYAAQALAFQLFGHPFCDDPLCRLFNAHRQEEMLRAQLEGPDFCEKHRRMFEEAGR